MKERRRVLESVRHGDAETVTRVDGRGPPLVVLPSYGRDGLEDFDCFTDLLVEAESVFRTWA